ncbi:arabinose 5-phosphate isomerase [Gemmatimonas aurantiaca T-27]|uniref:Arabinose 5-phosphate isomerase n=1 Tax=Gemmatimonas aurantiaca (strain DSM 14586 / JCM 11422 / NBRC 100505 / T-27) TaxID=379066 RepID=C1A8V3_GEMAT|nr:KpsF/GutQ family sugar-phosphate isomerase [Gemmatimonas aurantiaca]BAH38663.1 arabinose 5-phosphate isomerase [Gemmatimonas aurantiaca T-27]
MTASDTTTILERGRRVLALEAEALRASETALGDEFVHAVQLLTECRGRVIVAGVGKSGLVARKMAATFTSTGTPAMFLHPVESVHGDLGIVGPDDVAILISKSGESDELLGLIEALARLGVRMIAMTAVAGSRLARHADVTLDLLVKEEACPHDLAPTTSTTVTMALGDALAVAVLQQKGFRAEDFARFHPGGALGRKLLTRVRDVMEQTNLPTLDRQATMREAVVLLAGRRGIAVVVEQGRVSGVVTAGDLTRLLERQADVLSMPVASVMSATPRLAVDHELGSAVVHRMETHGIMAMPVIDADERLVGVVHLHDLMRAGAV